MRKDLCRNFCVYYKPSNKEDVSCLGVTVIERLKEKRQAISFRMHKANPKERTSSLLAGVLCKACPFHENDCDFAENPGRPPCGGFIILGLLLDRKDIHIDDIKNII